MPYLPDLILRQVAGDAVASDMLYRGALIESTEAAQVGIVHAVVPQAQVETQAVERLNEIADLVPQAFRAAKSNRVEQICARYQAGGAARNQEFLDIWFSPATQVRLREGARKF